MKTGTITAVYREKYRIQFDDRDTLAEVSGRFRHDASEPVDFPVVGDRVAADEEGGTTLIKAILPRRSLLSRRAPGKGALEQPLAANVDVAFIVTDFGADFSIPRLERYAVLLRQAGIRPVIVLNKNDLAAETDALKSVHENFPNETVLSISAINQNGLDPIKKELEMGDTGVLLGSSGVGKSTLLNALLGEERQKTTEIREKDEKGRHTTTGRHMFPIPTGGFMIDTPGLREVQLWADDEALEDVFEDVAELAAECKYADCHHADEPGCRIRTALEDGTLSADRYARFQKLQKELAYLKRKADPEQMANTKRRWKKIHKQIRATIDRKRKPN